MVSILYYFEYKEWKILLGEVISGKKASVKGWAIRRATKEDIDTWSGIEFPCGNN